MELGIYDTTNSIRYLRNDDNKYSGYWLYPELIRDVEQYFSSCIYEKKIKSAKNSLSHDL